MSDALLEGPARAAWYKGAMVTQRLGSLGALAGWLAAAALMAGGCKREEGATTPPATAAAGGAAEAAEDDEEEAAEEESPYLDASNFNDAVEARVGEIVACYEKTAGKEATPPTGRVRATVVVNGDGKVKDVTFDPQRSDLKHDGLYACMKETIRGWSFNITLTGGDSPMPYTFDLRRGGLL